MNSLVLFAQYVGAEGRRHRAGFGRKAAGRGLVSVFVRVGLDAAGRLGGIFLQAVGRAFGRARGR